MMMMMMIMTLMKLVNSATKFRHGMDKFYQPNSGLGSSRSLHEAIYTYVHMYIYCIYIYIALEWDTWQTKLTMEIQWNITTALKLTYHNMVFQHSYGTWPIDE